MSAESERIFFPLLKRQDSYPIKPDGSFYIYTYYREHIAQDCAHRCVYCDALADEVGGAEAMQLDHFRPESFDEFGHLINNPRNLHYACGRCNLLKSNHWPARGIDAPHNGKDGFIDPFDDDRLAYFEISLNGEIRAIKSPATYVIRLLRLDREFLRKLRELRILKSRWRKKVTDIRRMAEAGKLPHPKELAETLAAIEALLA
jgi:hypothetical protein